MPKYFNTAFKNDPVKFMKTYPFSVNKDDFSQPLKNNLGHFDFVLHDDFSVISLELSKTPTKNDSVYAYYLPYGDDQTHSLQLGSMADYMFTPALTGCTFVAGAKWYSPTVAHVNYQYGAQHHMKGQIDQKTIGQKVTGIYGNSSMYQVTKTDYISKKEDDQGLGFVKLLIVGVRGYLGWYFYKTKLHMVGLGEYKVMEGAVRIN